jgi:hypothetical protein
MSFIPEDFKEYCKESGNSTADPTSKLYYQKQVKTVSDLKKIFSEEDMACLPTSSSMSDEMEESLIYVEDITDYNRLTDLRDQVERYGKLLSRYGYDLNKGEQNTSLFPVTKTDSQLEGIKSDIEEHNRGAKTYNKFLKSVVKKYNNGVFDERKKYFFTIPELKRKIINNNQE